jgi:hypothetical protein
VKDMSKTVYIGEEELSRQASFMEKVCLLNKVKGKKAHVITYGCQQNESD